eukprot:1596502-Pyramimonas_sp.AAC.1
MLYRSRGQPIGSSLCAVSSYATPPTDPLIAIGPDGPCDQGKGSATGSTASLQAAAEAAARRE